VQQNQSVDKKSFTPSGVLAQNLKALMRAKAGPKSQMGLGKKSSVAQATIGRILSQGGENARIETVAKLAKAYGLEAWQLMVPGMDPVNPPVLQAASKEERELYDRLRQTMRDLARLEPDR